MLKFIATRTLAAVPVMIVVSVVVFLLLRLSPGDPALVIAGENADADAVEGGRLQARLFEHLGHQRRQPLLVAPAHGLGAARQQAAAGQDGRLAGVQGGVEGEESHAGGQASQPASSKARRGARGGSLDGSPRPMEQMKLDLTAVPAKNSRSTPALSKPDIGPQSKPRARACTSRRTS